MRKKEKNVSLIVPVWYKDQAGFDMTVSCLNSMAKTKYKKYEIIAVHDCPPMNGFSDLVKKTEKSIKHIRTDENIGSTGAVNYGIKHANYDYIQYQNNDTFFPHDNWLEEQMKMFDIPGVGIVGCKMRYPNGKIQHAGACWRNTVEHIIDHIGQHQDEIEYLEDVPFVTGCGMTVKRNILEKNWGGFTEFKGYGWDDIDIQVKAKKMGYSVKLAFKAEFVHDSSYSYKYKPELANKKNYMANMKKFMDIDIKEEETIEYFKKKYYLL